MMKENDQWILVSGAGIGVFMTGTANLFLTTGINNVAALFVGVCLAAIGYMMLTRKVKK